MLNNTVKQRRHVVVADGDGNMSPALLSIVMLCRRDRSPMPLAMSWHDDSNNQYRQTASGKRQPPMPAMAKQRA